MNGSLTMPSSSALSRQHRLFGRELLRLAIVTLAAVVALFSNQPENPAQSAEAVRAPNIIFILADDLGWSDTTLYGTTKFYQTPNLKRLAKRGVTLTRAYSASPLCSPTRSAILTGLSPARTGITTPNCHLPQVVLEATIGKAAPPAQKSIQPTPASRLKLEYRTLAESLKDAGYATGHFGKWHLGAEPYSPLQQGFDVDVPHHPGPGPAGSYVAPWKFKDFDHDPDVPHQHIEDRMAKEAAAFIQQHHNRPFFLNYWMFSVHAPFDAKSALIEKHRARVNPHDAQRCPTYAAMVESMDDAVGTLLNALDQHKLTDNTIIIFTADNGGNMYSDVQGEVPTSNAPLRGGKATLFEGGTRVPCVIVMPGVTQPGNWSDAIVQSEDYYPTLLEAIGIKPQPGQQFDGISLLPALKQSKASPLSITPDPALNAAEQDQRAVFQYFPHSPSVPDWLPPAVSVHRGDWKLIRIFHGGDQGQHRYLLFNLREDLGEKHNLALKHPMLVAELDAMIESFLTETKAVVPVPNPAFNPADYRPELEGQATVKRKAASQPQSKETTDPLQGWKARNCAVAVQNGIVHTSKLTEASFLGFSAAKHGGPSTIKLRIKSAAGESHVDWLPAGIQDKAQSVSYTLPGGDWQELTISIPATGPLGIVRVYLPQQDHPIEIDWIEIKSESSGKLTRSGF